MGQFSVFLLLDQSEASDTIDLSLFLKTLPSCFLPPCLFLLSLHFLFISLTSKC